VDLVDEEDRAIDLLERLDDRLDALLEIATIAGSGEERSHVEGVHRRADEGLGDLSAVDLEREPFGDGRLADARVSHEQRVILLTPRQDLDDARDLVLAANERVDAGALGLLVEVDGVGLQRVPRRTGGFSCSASAPLVLPASSGSSSSLDTPCETYDTMSSRVTPWSSISPTAKESRSWNIAMRTLAPVNLFLTARLHVVDGALDRAMHAEGGLGRISGVVVGGVARAPRSGIGRAASSERRDRRPAWRRTFAVVSSRSSA